MVRIAVALEGDRLVDPRQAVAALTAALLMALVGCAGDRELAGDAPATTSTSELVADPSSVGGRILTGDGFQTLVAATEVHLLAALRGQLAIGDGGCLVMRDAQLRSHVVVWPPTVTLRTDGTDGVHVPEVGAIAVGDHISGSGGYGDTTPTEAPPTRLHPPVPPECDTEHTIALFGTVSNLGTD
ncbi:hypothetical protein E0H26_26600 [Micromonospora zingiberis]|uniref:Uncharacterized protein n=1 Tax=Micromonospora zingiberis TaxID=2053011 RepID=A0A4R0G4D6_9ACTN|nr:hypothetical protein [Micromonospora zingiberis]TCB90762.1 hypothetical protein E0H26_26600 [Micromonospora zingiberis]